MNRNAPRDYRIDNATGDAATVYLYDVIGYDFWSGGGVTAKQFAKDFNAITAPTINLRVNSPGGDVFEGRAMVSALQQARARGARVIAHVDGIAASAASFLVMHAHEVRMTAGSFMMIHNGWTLAMGDRHTMRETGDLLEQIDATIVADYRTRVDASAEDIGAMMDAETWMEASDAVARGFADTVVEEGNGKANARAWNAAAYDNPPAQLNAQVEDETPSESADEPDNSEAEHAARVRRLALVEATSA